MDIMNYHHFLNNFEKIVTTPSFYWQLGIVLSCFVFAAIFHYTVKKLFFPQIDDPNFNKNSGLNPVIIKYFSPLLESESLGSQKCCLQIAVQLLLQNEFIDNSTKNYLLMKSLPFTDPLIFLESNISPEYFISSLKDFGGLPKM